MSQSIEYRLVLKKLPFGITNSGKNQKLSIHMILNDIQSNLGRFELNRNNMSIHLNLDWSKAISDIEKNMEKNFFIDELYTEFEKYKDKYESINDFFNERAKEIPKGTEVVIVATVSKVDIVELDQTIKNFVYHLFLVLNLSYPGFINYYNARLLSPKNSEELTLCNDEFEECWSNENWPIIKYIPINTVCNWYNKYNLWNKFISETRLDKCLFSLLHFCEEIKISPSKIVWLAHALESIYEIPQSAILHSLKDRISIVLFENYEEERSKISKRINEFYQYRSNFVHGNLTIYTPSEELINSDIHKEYLNQLFQTENFAFRILVATLQKMIIEDWNCFNFKTIFEGA
ncbi:hypothetical protein J2T12_003742 [Paenibacillus anaericanus]|uniref:HEPN domain-containing protein n=1 Tax=Paenibacillus anaericanus TaxID=170367 RepID=UPI00277FE4D2|nr:HEPN domain-containing protein [Paenibacillus anaericanus]MDQ0090328.1 hypothetical protein [Paenibacillus anaericanus]